LVDVEAIFLGSSVFSGQSHGVGKPFTAFDASNASNLVLEILKHDKI